MTINLAPHLSAFDWLKEQRQAQPKTMVHNILGELLPKRLAQKIVDEVQVTGRMADQRIKPCKHWLAASLRGRSGLLEAKAIAPLK